jgi:TonB-dependent receptor
MKSAVDQTQIKGKWDLDDVSGLDFGVSLTKVNNRTAFSNVQRDTWGGATNAADYPDSVWKADTIRPYFSKLDGSGSSSLFNQFFTFDFETVRALAAAAGGDPSLYQASPNFTVDSRVVEKSQSAFVQYSREWDWIRPMQLAVGLRYEKTNVNSMALVPTATGITWVANNEFSVAFGAPGFTTLTGTYNYVLPSVDYDVALSKDMKLRASYGETIGRPRWDAIQGGQTINQLVRIDGGTGAQGNPALKPLKSKNFDLSFEYYYAKGSYAAVGLFNKRIDNYIGFGTTNGTPFNLNTPANGTLFKEAVTNGCTAADLTCIRNYILNTYNGRNGVTKTGVDANGNATGSIAGQASDPVANFRITTQANQRSASLNGVELNVQHMLGNTGFGVAANYTLAKSPIKYDNKSRGEQFAIEGLSDSANLVGFYENNTWNIRVAYNWRDKFLTARTDGAGNSPIYTQAYGQVDVNVGYQMTPNLSLQAEVINLTDSTKRLHGRTQEQVFIAEQTGPRYMVGARYKF